MIEHGGRPPGSGSSAKAGAVKPNTATTSETATRPFFTVPPPLRKAPTPPLGTAPDGPRSPDVCSLHLRNARPSGFLQLQAILVANQWPSPYEGSPELCSVCPHPANRQVRGRFRWRRPESCAPHALRPERRTLNAWEIRRIDPRGRYWFRTSDLCRVKAALSR